jgi:hypothetical protein
MAADPRGKLKRAALGVCPAPNPLQDFTLFCFYFLDAVEYLTNSSLQTQAVPTLLEDGVVDRMKSSHQAASDRLKGTLAFDSMITETHKVL